MNFIDEFFEELDLEEHKQRKYEIACIRRIAKLTGRVASDLPETLDRTCISLGWDIRLRAMHLRRLDTLSEDMWKRPTRTAMFDALATWFDEEPGSPGECRGIVFPWPRRDRFMVFHNTNVQPEFGFCWPVLRWPQASFEKSAYCALQTLDTLVESLS